MEVPNSSEIPPAEGAIQHLLKTEVEEIDPHDPRLGFLTWTSIEMVRKMAITGKSKFRGSTEDLGAYDREEVYGIALPGMESAAIDFPRNEDINNFLSNPDEARVYAQNNARRLAGMHYFLDQFGMPFDNPELNNAVGNYIFSSDPEIRDFLDDVTGSEEYAARSEIDKSLGLIPFIPSDAIERIPLVADEARKRKGIVLGVTTPSSDSEFRVLGLLAPEDYHMRFSFGPKGMSFKHIGANKPEGEHEKAFYATLRKGNIPPKTS